MKAKSLQAPRFALVKRLVTVALCSAAAACATTEPSAVWSVGRTTDPITSVTRCVVSAFDRAEATRMSRTGYLYPFVEMNSEAGLGWC